MKPQTKRLLEVVEANHDWDKGQTYGGGGTVLQSLAICRCCNLRRRWYSDKQNGIEDRYTFELNGVELSLKEAAALVCCEEG